MECSKKRMTPVAGGSEKMREEGGGRREKGRGRKVGRGGVDL